MNAPGLASTGFAQVGYAEALERARGLVPALRERATRGDEARRMLPETEADLHRTGLFRFVQPKRYGGMELDFVSMVEVPAEIGRGCASTAWNVGNLAIHHWMLALYDERAQDEVWGPNPDALIASGIAFPQGQARKADGGFVLSGRWNFSSGVDPSEWNMLAATVRDGERVTGYRMCLVHRSEYEIVDDWNVLGMRATGSKSVRAKDVFVPEHRALDMLLCARRRRFPGRAREPEPALPGARSRRSARTASSVRRSATRRPRSSMTCEAVKARSTSYTAVRMRDFQAVQLRVGAAGARIEAARALFLADCYEAQRYRRRRTQHGSRARSSA